MSRYDWNRIDQMRAHGATWPEIAEIFGVAPSTLRGANSRRSDSTSPGSTSEVPPSPKLEGSERTVEVTGTTDHRITCLRELYNLFEIPYRIVEDPETGELYPYSDVYEVIDVTIDGNSWDVSMKLDDGPRTITNYQYEVKARLRPRRQEESFEATRLAVQAMLDEVGEHAPDHAPTDKPEWFRRLARGSPDVGDEGDPVLFELAVFDPHIGMLGWGAEVGANYDSKIAIADYADAVDYLLRFAYLYPVEKILFLVGNDFFHVDSPAFDARGSGSGRGGATTAGTQQDVDTRLAKMFTAGRRALVSGIDKARSIAPVDVLVVPGNHDEQQMYRMAEVLSAWYRNTDSVNVLYGPNRRKYYQYGKNAFMFTHGVEYKRQRDNLPLIFATECPPEMWAATTHREIHTGHNHISKGGRVYHPELDLNETRTIRTRSLPGLTPEDAWHYHSGYKHRRTASGLAFRRSGGPIGVHEFNLDS